MIENDCRCCDTECDDDNEHCEHCMNLQQFIHFHDGVPVVYTGLCPKCKEEQEAIENDSADVS